MRAQLFLVAFTLVTTTLVAQRPNAALQARRRAADPVQGPGPGQGQGAPARERLIQQITERFMENYRQQAGLSPEQNQKFRAVAQRSFEQRRERQQKERDLWNALESQMRPGVAANSDSVSRLLDAIVTSRAAAIDQAKADQKEFSTFLSPVQRAQLFLAFERLQRNIETQVQRRLQMMQGGGGGGAGALPPEN
jgi:hypothetical protein